MLKKIILMVVICSGVSLANAENIIYKCTSPTGDISYVNINNKSNLCVKTDIVAQEKFNSINKSKGNSSSPNLSQASMQVFNEEQQNRDSKRSTILSKELQEEETQLATVSNMLKNLDNAKSTDTKQIQELTSLQTTHIKNIESLKKELGIKENKNIVNTALKIEKATEKPLVPTQNTNKVAINTDIKK